MNKLESLAQTAIARIATIDNVHEFSDDHIACATVTMTTVDGEQFSHDFMWIGTSCVAAFEYFNATPKARENVVPAFVTALEIVLEDFGENTDDDEGEWHLLNLAGFTSIEEVNLVLDEIYS